MNEQSGKWKAESGTGSTLPCCAPASSRFPLSTFRFGVTLIELLITITIISILSASFLGVSNLAMESAREARTKTIIGKIHGLLMEKWASYETRRVDIDNDIETAIRKGVVVVYPGQRDLQGRALGMARANARLLAVRELMSLEMPDSWSDILGASVGSNLNSLPPPRVLETFPALRQSYLRRYSNLKQDPTTTAGAGAIIDNQGAECLYMIVMLSTGDGEARTLFSERDIGDTDNDGAPEFLDGWGRPIHFIRWAPGFLSKSDLMSGDADSDHDPMDVFRRDQLPAPIWPHPNVYRDPDTNVVTVNPLWIQELSNDTPAFRLVPLVYSAGADGETDIDDQAYAGSPPVSSLDPYAIDPSITSLVSGDNFVFGVPRDMNSDGDDNSIDNVHNHLQDNK